MIRYGWWLRWLEEYAEIVTLGLPWPMARLDKKGWMGMEYGWRLVRLEGITAGLFDLLTLSGIWDTK
jgi:hypothetical protein